MPKYVRFPGFVGIPANLASFPGAYVLFAILKFKIPVRRAIQSFQESSGISLARHNRVCKLAGLVQTAYRKQTCLKRPVERPHPLLIGKRGFERSATRNELISKETRQ